MDRRVGQVTMPSLVASLSLAASLVLAAPALAQPQAGSPAPAPSAAAASTVPAGAVEAGAAGVTSVQALDSVVRIRGTASPGSRVTVRRLSTEEPVTADAGAVVGRSRAGADGSFAVAAARTAGGDELYDKYIATVDGTVVGTYRYVSDFAMSAPATYPYPTSPTKKGLQVKMTSDAEELGVGHAAINLAFNELVQDTDEGPGKTLVYRNDGRTYYFDADYIADLDRQIKPLSDRGAVVNLILILYRGSATENSAWEKLIFPDYNPAGIVYALDTKTAEGVAYTRAVMEFVTSRWTRSDQKYGRATGFIIGNEVDAQWVWQNAGEKSLEDFVLYYERQLRIAYTAARKAYTNARVYTSLTNSWASDGNLNPMQMYPGRDVVNTLNAATKAHGDYPWQIAYHPYPQNLFKPDFWNDPGATGDMMTTPHITFKNIELLPAYLRQSEQLYAGSPRRVILSEQGCNTPNDSLEAQKLQAACFALAYYKVTALPEIDSFILHRHVDHKLEGGLRLGLWTWFSQDASYETPTERKYIYDVYRDIDTSRSLQATADLLGVIGISDWSQMVPGFDPSALAVRIPASQLGSVRTTSRTGTRDLSGDPYTTQRWRPADAVESVTTSGRTATATFAQDGRVYRGLQFLPWNPVSARPGQRWLTYDVTADAAPEVGTRFVQTRISTTSGRVAEATTVIAHPGTQQVAVDLGDWLGSERIAKIKVWVKGSAPQVWEGTLAVSNLALARSVTPESAASNVDITATAEDTVKPGTQIAVSVTNHQGEDLSAELTVETCDGISLSPDPLTVTGLAPRSSTTLTATVTQAAPADPNAPVICLRSGASSWRVPIVVAPPKPHVLYSFDDGTTQGWVAGENMGEVSAVTSMLNGPQTPHQGTHSLDGHTLPVAATAPKGFRTTPATPLDLSDAVRFSLAVNSWGGVPGATGYQVTVTLRSGADTRSLTKPYNADTWNVINVDIADWAGRSSIDGIEVTMAAVGTDFGPWDPHLQIDSVVWYDRLPPGAGAGAGIPLSTLEDGRPTGWTAGDNVIGVDAVTAFANGPNVPAAGSYALELTSANVATSLPRRVSFTPSEPVSIGTSGTVVLQVNSYGGAPGVSQYFAKVTVHSGGDSREALVEYRPDGWTPVSVDVRGWAGRSSIDRVDVEFTLGGGSDTTLWNPKYQIDDLRALP